MKTASLPARAGDAPEPRPQGRTPAQRPEEDAMSDAPPVSTELVQVLDPDGKVVDEAFVDSIPLDDVVALYRAMLAQRVYDDRMIKMQRQGRLGFYLACTGEEACCYGPTYALEDRDWLFPAYREPGTALWRGMSLQKWVDNLVGNEDDPVKGRQMPVHWTDREHNIVSISSPVGTQIPQATGVAWAAKYRGDDTVACAFFGEGTSSEGDFHTGLNFAGVWKAPVIFFCRNNRYAISTPLEKTTAVEDIVLRAHGYGIRGVKVDGNDLFAVIKVVREAAAWARAGKGPTLIEAKSYRMAAHSTSDDPSKYRPEGEAEAAEARDPLKRLRVFLEARGVWDDAAETAAAKAASDAILAALEKAEAKAHPGLDTLFDDVFAELPDHLRTQRDELAAHLASGEADYTPKTAG
jgi:2-oxoisovalerate dehydrogenase E1 component alpha subunit